MTEGRTVADAGGWFPWTPAAHLASFLTLRPNVGHVANERGGEEARRRLAAFERLGADVVDAGPARP